MTDFNFVPTKSNLIMVTLLAGMAATLTVAAAFSVMAAALVMLALWLVRYDVARRTIKSKGLTRFIAIRERRLQAKVAAT